LAYLLNEGTQKRDSRAIAEAAQGYGGSVGGATGMDGITVTGNALASYAEPMIHLLAEVARQPVFSAKEVELAKANALQALKAAEATPRFRADRALGAAIYGEHRYGHIDPTADAINAITPELLRSEHAKRFRPDRSLLVITGRIDKANALKLATAAFGDWKVVGGAGDPLPQARAAAEPVKLLLPRSGSVQSTVRLGRPGIAASASDYVPLRLTSTILGGGFSSRVNLNLREEKGYTYGASAGARSYRLGGGIVGGADVRNAVTGASIKEFLDEYRRIGTELVGAEEMAMNKRYMAGTYLVTTQLQKTVADTLANNWLIGLPAEFLGEFVPKIQQVSAEQVREMGKKYFAPEMQSLVVVGEKDAIAEQLKAFGEFSIVEK
jgi:zinc protease